MCSKGVSKGVRGDALLNLCEGGGIADGFLQGGFVNVMAANDSCFGVGVERGGGEDVLPNPLFVGSGDFFVEPIRHVDRAVSAREVFLVDGFYAGEVFFERGDEAFGEGGCAVISAFPIIDEDAVILEVNIFDAQAQTFHESQSAAVHDLRHEFVAAIKVGDDGAGFVFGEDGGDALASFGADESEVG